MAKRVKAPVGYGMRSMKDSKGSLSYRAAQTSRITPYRVGLGGSGDAHTKETDLWEMREYARRLDRDNVIAHAILDRSVEAVIGDGIRTHVESSSTSFADNAERLWKKYWNQEADSRGFRRGWELEALVYRSLKCDGDILVVKEDDGKISIVEGDRIATPSDKKNITDGTLHAGVHMDMRGKLLNFYVCKDAINNRNYKHSYNDFMTISADRCLWLANTHRPSMTRGVTAFASSMQLYEDIDAFLEACIINAKMSVAHVMFIKRENGGADLDGTEETTDGWGNDRTEQVISPGTILYGKPGESASMIGSTMQMVNFGPFMKQLLRFAGISFGLPLEVVGLDFSDTNYSSARAAMLVAHKAHQRNHKTMVDNFLAPLMRWKIEQWIKEGLLNRPAYYSVAATPPRQISIDPNKEMSAEVVKVQHGFSTNADVCSILGFDFDDVLQRRANEISKAKKAADKIDPDDVNWRDLIGDAKNFDAALYSDAVKDTSNKVVKDEK